jgi:hypothetical protein
MTYRYTSFKQIDERLRILALQREISKESLKLNLYSAKRELNPSHLIGGWSGSLQKLVLTWVLKTMVAKFRKPKEKKEEEISEQTKVDQLN